MNYFKGMCKCEKQKKNKGRQRGQKKKPIQTCNQMKKKAGTIQATKDAMFIDVVTIKSVSFNSIRSIIITKLETRSRQKRTKIK